MVRTFLIAIAALFATEAAAQQVVLAHGPPEYRDSEVPPGPGVLVTKEGLEMSLPQQAKSAPDGRVYLVMTLSGRRGALGSVVFDPRTLRGYLLSGEESTIVKSTTCTPDRVYPIYENKVLECADELLVTDPRHAGPGRMLTNRSRSVFGEAERDPGGLIAGYCMHVNADDGERLMEARVCFSKGGKWVRSVRIISSEARKDI